MNHHTLKGVEVHYIFVVSDGEGRTATQALRAALTQFSDEAVEIVVYPNIKTDEQVIGAVEDAVDVGAMIVHTMVSAHLRDLMLARTRLLEVDAVDLMGPLLAGMSLQFSHKPSEEPGLFYELNKEYFQRIEAVEYTLLHDDGQRVDELSRAEIVLVGVSRTFKTPLSIYLAMRGWFVANVPIIAGTALPPELFEVPPSRVFGLITDQRRLTVLRRVRHEYLGGSTGEYANPDYVGRELRYARRIFSKNPGWKVINVTNRPIEEIAAKIRTIMKDSG